MKPYWTASALAAIMAMATPAVVAADAAGAPEWLLGKWLSDCTFFGTPANCALAWTPGLHDTQMRATYVVRARGGDTVLFSGESVYRSEPGRLSGYWMDTNGSLHPIHATATDSVLTSHWGEARTEQGRSEYRLEDDGSLTVTDWALTEAGWREFMRASYRMAR